MTALAKNRIDDAAGVPGSDAHGLGAASRASLALHAGVAALLFGLTWVTLREPTVEPVPEVFRVVPTGVGAHAKDVTERALDADAGLVASSEAERLFVAPPSVRSWTPPPPPRVMARSEPRISERVEPPRDARPTSYEEHLRRQGLSPDFRRPRSGAAETVAPVGPGTRINVDQVRGEPGVGVALRSLSDDAVRAAMLGYFGDLVGRLRDAHELPGGVSDLLSAEVQFTIASNGTVSGVRIVRSSGSRDFDESVLEAFGRLKMPGRPDKKTDVQRLTFRIKEA